MEWLTRISDAIDFIEKNIAEKIDYTEVAKIACCAVTRFQNMFMFITDITPAEYVRRRRMSLSAKELLGSGIKIIDLSYKYGYESPEAFTRSFKAFHGISPSDVRKFGKYIEYPRIAFKLQIQGGHFIMDSGAKFEVYKDILVKMEIIELAETLKLVAVTGEYYPSFQNIGVYHEKYKANVANKYEPYIELGLASNVDKRAWYMFGCQVTSIGELPEGLVGVDMGLKK
ncbi:MAG: AraC family transcriptional regulator, partial [Defluviitaleaceae bacterium]|nr:AraC family transcriptional regulator [Defluviitaleaceae bacterium]